MKRITLLSLAVVFLCGGLVSCGKPYTGPAADLVIKNAKVVTIDKQHRRAQAVAVSGEKIVAVTSNRRIKDYIDPEKTIVIDAGGRLVLPGFNDAHLHFLSGGLSLINLDFRNITDVKVIQKMVEERVSQVKPGELIRGRGWDHELFPDKQWPTKEILDKVAPRNPVVLSRVDGHSVWVNSYELRVSGITRETSDPPGGAIVRDPVSGEPTGILKETAEDLLKEPELSEEETRQRNLKALELSFQRARETGVTSVQHLNLNEDLLQKLKDEGRLTARVTFNLWLTDDPAELKKYDELRKQYPRENNWLRAGYMKDFMDGSLGSETALMLAPFDDDPSTSGLAQMSYQELERKVLAADEMGFQIGIHAIGDKANRWILNAYAKAAEVNGKRDSRHRSEHAQILAPEDIPRFAQLGVIASMQPTHCISDKRYAEKRIGHERCRGAYAWKSLLDSGAHLAFGTDWPVEPLNPMEGLYAAVTRKDRAGEAGEGWFPEEKLSMEKAIELYTLGSAYAEFMEDRKGMIRPGYLADMVILNQDLFSVPENEIMKTKVDYTIVGGRVVYQRDQEQGC